MSSIPLANGPRRPISRFKDRGIIVICTPPHVKGGPDSLAVRAQAVARLGLGDDIPDYVRFKVRYRAISISADNPELNLSPAQTLPWRHEAMCPKPKGDGLTIGFAALIAFTRRNLVACILEQPPRKGLIPGYALFHVHPMPDKITHA